MSRGKNIENYVNDVSRNAVCGEMILKFSNGPNETKNKLCFESSSEAMGYSKAHEVAKDQVPYLCQFCQSWHLGNSSKLGREERSFIVTGYGDLMMRPEVVEGTPLYNAVLNLDPQKHKLTTNELISFQKALDEHGLFNITPTSARMFKATPQMRAVVWAIHSAAPRQVVMLISPSGRLIYKRNATDYWAKHLIEQ